jgi:hypothetical protein
MTAQAPNGTCARGVWVIDAGSLEEAEAHGRVSAMRGGWVPLQVHWVETTEENDARIAREKSDAQ